MNKYISKRMIVTVITGSILGVVCIIGAQLRSGFENEALYLFSFWFNRFLMGILFGFLTFELPYKQRLLRGLLLGFLVSFAFYSATGFNDLTGFIAGGIYGVIIEAVADKYK